VKIIETVSENAEETLALATLGRLTRGALHEISNPLVALLGSAELALAEAQPGTKLHARLSLTHRTGT
jgi:signal transduction histidine kinase